MHFYNPYINEIYYLEKSHFVYHLGNPMIPHLLCYQGLAVDYYGFALDAEDLGHLRLSLI